VGFAEAKNKFTLLVFYKSSCAPCNDLIAELGHNYKTLKNKGIEIVTVSADTDQGVFEKKCRTGVVVAEMLRFKRCKRY
jgi:peroxiredoxin